MLPQEGMQLLTWSGREEETGAELLLQALDHRLGVGEDIQTRRHRAG